MKTVNSCNYEVVPEVCICCGACWRLDENHFESHAIHAYAFVSKQPQGFEEVEQVEAALVLCPVQAIRRKLSSCIS